MDNVGDNMIFCGVDVGLDGAFVTIDEDNQVVDYFSMPIIETKTSEGGGKFSKKKNKVKRNIDIKGLVDKVSDTLELPYIIIEDVSASPQMGAVSSFKFGHGLGVLEGMLEYSYYGQDNISKVKPNVWTRLTKNTIGKDAKERSYNYFKINHPEQFNIWDELYTKKKVEGLIDAFLIAKWFKDTQYNGDDGLGEL